MEPIYIVFLKGEQAYRYRHDVTGRGREAADILSGLELVRCGWNVTLKNQYGQWLLYFVTKRGSA
jgi:hypothetical protein